MIIFSNRFPLNEDVQNYQGAEFQGMALVLASPEINRIKKAKFSLNGISGLFEKYDVIIENIL